jgi:hypothetical protein
VALDPSSPSAPMTRFIESHLKLVWSRVALILASDIKNIYFILGIWGALMTFLGIFFMAIDGFDY